MKPFRAILSEISIITLRRKYHDVGFVTKALFPSAPQRWIRRFPKRLTPPTHDTSRAIPQLALVGNRFPGPRHVKLFRHCGPLTAHPWFFLLAQPVAVSRE